MSYNFGITKITWKRGSFLLMKGLLFLVFPLLIVCFAEYASSGSVTSVLGLMTDNAVSFFFSYFIVLLVFSLLFLLIGAYSFFLSFVLFFLLAAISFYKHKILGDYLFPTDIFVFGGSAGNLAKFVRVDIDQKILLGALLGMLLTSAFFYFFRKSSLSIKKRVLLFLSLSLFSVYFFSDETFRLSGLKTVLGFNIEDVAWRQKYNYEHNGFITAFYVNIGNIYIQKPEGYSEEKIKSILSGIQKRNTDPQTEKPNVIFVLSEAFWDITKIPGISFRKDPLENFRKLKNESTSGNLISPTYGGRTQWVEFEILTGNMIQFLPYGSMPYEQYIKHPIPSVAYEFKKNGYETWALHTYEKTFFNRHKAYPLLGFDTYVGVEDLENPRYKGPFVSDDEFVDQIIKKLERKKSDPLFVFGVTMQNHFSYEGEKYPELDIEIRTDPNLSYKSRRILENYAQGISDADKSLAKLIGYLKESKKPTVVVFFGDHLGSMGDNYYTYKETGYLQDQADWSKEDFLKMHTTEYLIWNNFGLKKEESQSIGASYLGNYVLDMLGHSGKHPYFDFISREFNDCFLADSENIVIDRAGNINEPNALKKECTGSESDHHLLQYDLMFGKGYSNR